MLLELCTKMGKLEQQCDQLVLMQLPDVIDQIIAKEPADVVCKQVALCDNSTAIVPAAFPPQVKSELCPVCKAAIGYLKETTKIQEIDVPTIQKQLDFACAFFQATFKNAKLEQCKAIVDKAADIISVIQKDDAQTICGNIVKVC